MSVFFFLAFCSGFIIDHARAGKREEKRKFPRSPLGVLTQDHCIWTREGFCNGFREGGATREYTLPIVAKRWEEEDSFSCDFRSSLGETPSQGHPSLSLTWSRRCFGWKNEVTGKCADSK